MHPKTGSSLDVIATFSRFDNESSPCMETDQEHGGLGSTVAVLERAAAIDHALRSGPFPGLSNCDTVDCPCMTNDGDPTSPCSMSLPGFIPHAWSRVAKDLPYSEHDSWIANDPTAWESEHFRPMSPMPMLLRGRLRDYGASPVACEPSTPTGLPALSFPWVAPAHGRFVHSTRSTLTGGLSVWHGSLPYIWGQQIQLHLYGSLHYLLGALPCTADPSPG